MENSFRGVHCPQLIACGVGFVSLLLIERVNIVFCVKIISV
jgi:hypothetical protein